MRNSRLVSPDWSASVVGSAGLQIRASGASLSSSAFFSTGEYGRGMGLCRRRVHSYLRPSGIGITPDLRFHGTNIGARGAAVP